MRFGQRFSLYLKICLPLLFLVAIRAYPQPFVVADALRAARSAQAIGQHQAAASALRQVLTTEPWRTNLWEEIGREELAAGRLAEAKDALSRAAQMSALTPDGQFELGEAYLRLGDNPAAAAAWQTLLDEAGPSARVYERLAQVQRVQHNLPAAVAALQAWYRQSPDDARVAFLLGMHLAAVNPDQALPPLLAATRLDTRYTADVQTLRRGLGSASTAANPAYGWLMIGRSLGRIGQWDLAAEAFQRAVELAPDYADAWAFLAEARYQLDGSGRTELDRAQTLDEGSPVVRAMLALYWRRQGEPVKALPYLQAIAQQEPAEPTWQVEIANTLVEIGDLEAARSAFQHAVDLAPHTAVYWDYLARFSTQYNVDVRDLGLPAARQALLIAPDDPDTLDTMGWTMAVLGDAVSAERFLQRALERDAAYAPALLHMGQLLIQQQDTRRAYPYLKQAAGLATDNPIGVIARRLLVRYYGEGG